MAKILLLSLIFNFVCCIVFYLYKKKVLINEILKRENKDCSSQTLLIKNSFSILYDGDNWFNTLLKFFKIYKVQIDNIKRFFNYKTDEQNYINFLESFYNNITTEIGNLNNQISYYRGNLEVIEKKHEDLVRSTSKKIDDIEIENNRLKNELGKLDSQKLHSLIKSTSLLKIQNNIIGLLNESVKQSPNKGIDYVLFFIKELVKIHDMNVNRQYDRSLNEEKMKQELLSKSNIIESKGVEIGRLNKLLETKNMFITDLKNEYDGKLNEAELKVKRFENDANDRIRRLEIESSDHIKELTRANLKIDEYVAKVNELNSIIADLNSKIKLDGKELNTARDIVKEYESFVDYLSNKFGLILIKNFGISEIKKKINDIHIIKISENSIYAKLKDKYNSNVDPENLLMLLDHEIDLLKKALDNETKIYEENLTKLKEQINESNLTIENLRNNIQLDTVSEKVALLNKYGRKYLKDDFLQITVNNYNKFLGNSEKRKQMLNILKLHMLVDIEYVEDGENEIIYNYDSEHYINFLYNYIIELQSKNLLSF